MMRFCQCAIEMSKQSTHKMSHHGAVLVKGNQIIARGYNNHRHHAEAKAILQCVQRVLQNSNGSKGSTKGEVWA